MQREAPPDPPSAPPAWQTSPWWWLRWVALPVITLMLIAGAVAWLTRPAETGERRVASADEPQTAERGTPEEGEPAPGFTLKTIDGDEVRLADFQGRVVLINFWATWCGPCREEMPLFEQARARHEADGLVILAVNVEEGIEKVRPFVERLDLGYPVLLDSRGTVARRYRVRSYPTTYFVGRDGRIEGRRVGQYTRTILLGRLEQLLEMP